MQNNDKNIDKTPITNILFNEYFPIKNILIGYVSYNANDIRHYNTNLSSYNFLYVDNGHGTVKINNTTFPFKKGDTIFINRNTQYSIIPLTPVSFISLNFVAEYISNMLIEYSINSGVFSIDSEMFFRFFLKSINVEKNKHLGFIIADKIHSLIISLAASDSYLYNNLYLLIKKEIDAHIYDKLSITELTDILHISKSTLMRTFKKASGLTPHEYLLGRKMEIAKDLLINSKLPLKNIAYMLCFSDEHYLSYSFKRTFGLSPMEYREKYKKNIVF